MPSQLDGYPVQVTFPVQWGEMDAYGHVNNSVFFRYFEIARIEFLDRIGFGGDFKDIKIGGILHSTSCRFRSTLKYPETITVGARVSEVGGDRFTLEYIILTEDATVAANGDSVVVSFDYATRTKTPIPAAVRGKIDEFSGS